MHEEGARLIHIGHLEGLAKSLQKKVREAIELTKDNQRITIVLAFNYGGRDEIVTAIKNMLTDRVNPEDVDADLVSDYSVYKGIPDLDLVIRTSGEQYSNFSSTQVECLFRMVFPESLLARF